MEHHQPVILHQDARMALPLAPGTIDLVVTSPPYFNLVDYGDDSQIGTGSDANAYISDLDVVWGNIAQHLHPRGTICINIASTIEMMRNCGELGANPRSAIERFFLGHSFYLHAEIVWDLGIHSYEQRVRDIPSRYPQGRVIFTHNFEYVLVFRRSSAFSPVEGGTQPRCESAIWNIPWTYRGIPPQLAPELVRRLLDIFSDAGDLVFDPFSGAGTVAVESYRSGRRFYGTEINAAFIALSEKRLEACRTEVAHGCAASPSCTSPGR